MDMQRVDGLEAARFQLSITVDYDLNGDTPQDLEEQLNRAARFLVDEGFLSGSLSATVASWDARVSRVK